jgi:hypothetical protein
MIKYLDTAIVSPRFDASAYPAYAGCRLSLKTGISFIKPFFFHFRGNMIADRIISGFQPDGIPAAHRYSIRGIRYIRFKREIAVLRHKDSPIVKRCKGAVLRITGRTHRTPWPRIAPQPHRTGSALRPRDSRRTRRAWLSRRTRRAWSPTILRSAKRILQAGISAAILIT